ncbi:MAG: glycosyltransferase family 39 protein [Deltaproteobacteria bacterium]|nr:glycosyltransferase family 39 protein [Deltaproteobacteria bacterium]
MPRLLRKNVSFALLPLLLLAAAPALSKWRGPFFQFSFGNQDPEYAYLMNSLSVLNLYAPWHRDHPGTTLQTLGAVLARVEHPTLSRAELNRAVVLAPERTLWRYGVVLTAICGLLMGWSAASVARSLRGPGALRLASLFLTVPFLSTEAWSYVGRFTPELPVLALATLVCAAALLTDSRRALLWLGVGFGLCMATKINGMPLLLFPVALALSRRKGLVRFFAIAAAAALAGMAPLFLRWKESVAYLLAVPLRVGFGRGNSDHVMSPLEWAGGIVTRAVEDPVMVIGLAAGAVLAELARREWRRRGDWRKLERETLLGLTGFLVVLGQVVMVGGMGHRHYLLPGFPPAALEVVLLVRVASRRWPRRAGQLASGAALLSTLGALVALGALLCSRPPRGPAQAASRLAIDEAVKSARCRLVPVAPSNTEVFAIAWGENFTNNRFVQTLEDAYPGQAFYDASKKGFLGFGQRPAANAADFNAGGPICLLGTAGDLALARFPLLLKTAAGDALYRYR